MTVPVIHGHRRTFSLLNAPKTRKLIIRCVKDQLITVDAQMMRLATTGCNAPETLAFLPLLDQSRLSLPGYDSVAPSLLLAPVLLPVLKIKVRQWKPREIEKDEPDISLCSSNRIHVPSASICFQSW